MTPTTASSVLLGSTRSPLIWFVRFSISYVVNAAKAAKADKDQRLIYVSVRLPSLVHMPAMRRWLTQAPSLFYPLRTRRPWPIPSHLSFTHAVKA